MRARHLVAVVATTAVGAALAPSSSAAATQELAGLTVVRADRSGSAELVLRRDAVLRLAPDGSSPDVRLDGGGRLVVLTLTLRQDGASTDGLTLVRVRRDGRSVTRSWVSGTAYPRPEPCDDATVWARLPMLPTPVAAGCPAAPTPTHVVIHQGRYHLRVLTDGAPVTGTVRLRGVPGTGTVGVTRTLASGVVDLAQRDELGGRVSRWESSLAVPTAAEGLVSLDAAWAPRPRFAGVTSCRYDAAAPQLPTDHLSNQCPGGHRGAFFGPVLNPLGEDYDPSALNGIGSVQLDPGPQRFGLAASDEAGVTVRSATLGWLARER